MLNSIKISVKDTIIYGLGNIAVKVVGLILIPLYTNPDFFSVNEFGILGILEISALVLTAVMASSLPQSLTRWYWDKEHIRSQKSIFFMTFITQLLVSAVLCSLLLPLTKSFSVILFGVDNWAKVTGLVILSSGLQSINNIINTLMRLQSKSFLYTLTNLSKLAIVLGLTIFLIVSRKMGLEGIYIAQVAGNLLFIIILSGYIIKNSAMKVKMGILRDMNVYGFPLLLANISAVLLNVIDRYALNSMALLRDVALYTLAFKITSVLKLVIVDSIKLSIAPLMIKKIDSPDNKRIYSKVLLYTSYVLMLGIIFISLFSYEIIKVLTGSRDFWNAVVIIPLLSVSIFFVNMKDITVYGLHIVKKTRIIGIVVVLATIVSLILNILLIPLWDIYGAAAATLLSQIFYWFIIYYNSQKNYHIPYEAGKLFLIFVIGSIFSLSALLVNDFALLPRLVIKSVLVISFPFVLYLFNFYEQVELLAIKGFIRKWSDIRNLKQNLGSLKNISEQL